LPTTSWSELRDRRMNEPGAAEEHDATRLAYELGEAVRDCASSAVEARPISPPRPA
jgi:hypothetical protein